MNQQVKYLGKRSFRSKVVVRTHTRRTDCYAWTTKVVGIELWYFQAWLRTTCRAYRRRTVTTRSRSMAVCTTDVWRTWKVPRQHARDGVVCRSTTPPPSALLTSVR